MAKLFFIFIFGLKLITPSYASLKNLAQSFLENNSQVKVAESQVKLAEIDLQAFEITRNTNFTLSSNYNENSLESFSAFAARFAGGSFRQPIERTSHAANVSKGFNWGGDLTFENTLEQIRVPGAPTIYGFTQSLVYTQNITRNFFGKSFYLQRDGFLSSLAFTEADSENTIQNALFQLVSDYYQAALNKSLVDLQNDAKKRALQRLNLIKRRVKDGLRERVDQIQAEISLFQADESVKSAKQSFTSSVEALSTAVHKPVSETEIIGLNEKAFAKTKLPKGTVEENKNVVALLEQVKATKARLTNADRNILPDVNFEVGATNNRFNDKTETAFSEGLIGGVNHEFRVGLNLTWAYDSLPEKVEKTRAMVNHKTSELRLERLNQDVLQTEKSIRDQIGLLDENLKSSTQRLKLANAALDEYNRLYSRGRADLDQLISAEETLINTEINHVRYISQRETLVHSLSFLYGNLRTFLTE